MKLYKITIIVTKAVYFKNEKYGVIGIYKSLYTTSYKDDYQDIGYVKGGSNKRYYL